MTAQPLSATLSELEEAAALVRRHILPTAQYAWPKLATRSGATVWVKHENHTPTGAFKVRGGLVYVDRLMQEHPATPGIVSATRGNHGQSMAFAARHAGLPVRIYVPLGNSSDQNASIRALGATVIEVGHDFEAARQAAIRCAAEERLHLVPSFHRDLVLGVASYALELFRAAPPLDAVYVGVGMGSGICGLIMARDALGLRTQIIGVNAALAPATADSFMVGMPVATESAQTFADGLATRQPNAAAIASICRGAERFILVDEDEIAEAIRIYFDDTHQVVEGAGAAALAALLQERAAWQGRQVGVILSGGNIERQRFRQILSGETPRVLPA